LKERESMNGMNILHLHPRNQEEAVFGRCLRAGEELKKTDVYDSTTGKWEPVPSALVGTKINGKPDATLIRPANSF